MKTVTLILADECDEAVSLTTFGTCKEDGKPKITTAAFSVKNGEVVRFPEDISIMTAEQLGKHGRWITDANEFYQLWDEKRFPLEKKPYLASDCVACSECLRVINRTEAAFYCNHCGAKMAWKTAEDNN